MFNRHFDPERIFPRIVLLCLSLLFTSVCLELFFRYAFVYSDSLGELTLSSRRWYAKYWKPINAAGLRDRDYTVDEWLRKKMVLVVGDSFAAGAGIKNIKDRFSSVLQSLLGNDWIVVTLAKGGWNTLTEVNEFKKFRWSPKIVVLSYYMNDIEDAASECHVVPEQRYFKSQPSGVLGYFVEHSFAFNFFYWMRFEQQHSLEGVRYYQDLLGCYHNPAIWSLQTKALEAFIAEARRRSSRLIVVIFPLMFNVQGSRAEAKQVADFFQSEGVSVMDLSEPFSHEDWRHLVVNGFDSHPNVRAHRYVGERLSQEILPAVEKN